MSYLVSCYPGTMIFNAILSGCPIPVAFIAVPETRRMYFPYFTSFEYAYFFEELEA